MSERQTAYARARLSGLNQTESAREAGYEGEGNALSVQGSRAENSPKVAAFLRQAYERLDAMEHDVLTMDECLQRLSRMARVGTAGKDELRALEALLRYNLAQREEKRSSPADIFRELLKADQEQHEFPPFVLCFLLGWKHKFWRNDKTFVEGCDLPQAAADRIREYPELVKLLKDHDLDQHLPEKGAGTATRANGHALSTRHAR